MNKLWLDDVRPPAEGWVGVKTVKECVEALQAGVNGGIMWDLVSLDHDLGAIPTGGDQDIYLRGTSPEGSGMDVVSWMIENNVCPRVVRVHSWSFRSHEMGKRLKEHFPQATIIVEQFEPRRGY